MRLSTLLAAIAVSSAAALAPAQTTQAASSATAPLQALDREVRSLYQATERHTVRVVVPVRITNIAEQHPLIKWAPQIDPRVLAEAARQQNGRIFVDVIRPATQPSATNASAPAVDSARIPLPTQITTTTNVEFAGIILDSAGDVLLPLYIEPGTQMQATVDDATATTASLVASDQLTALSVVKLAKPAGEPAAFAQS